MTTTELLRAWSGGDVGARDELVRRLYPELRRLAAVRLKEAGGEVTFQATDLAHEAFLRLADQRDVQWENRSHFFAVVARLIRQILLNHIRDRNRMKRGGHLRRVTIELDHVADDGSSVDLLALDRALDSLAEVDNQAARVVELRYILGLTVPEVAEVLRVSESTVARQWRSARLWLRATLQDQAHRLASSRARPEPGPGERRHDSFRVQPRPARRARPETAAQSEESRARGDRPRW